MNTNCPKLSVITVNYNNVSGLEKTARCISSQTALDEFEWVVIDGASDDGSVEVIRQYESIITSWISEPDRGIYNAMNKGLKLARGEYVIFLNSGDEFVSDKTIKEFLNVKYYSNYDILVGHTEMHDEQRGVFVYKARDITSATDLLQFPICHQSTFIKLSLFSKENYDESYVISADMKWNFKKIVLEGCRYATLPLIISRYDCGGISSKKWWKTEEENKRYLNELLPELVAVDIEQIIYPKDEITKLLNHFSAGAIERRLIYYVALVLYFPKWVINKLTK